MTSWERGYHIEVKILTGNELFPLGNFWVYSKLIQQCYASCFVLLIYFTLSQLTLPESRINNFTLVDRAIGNNYSGGT